MANQYQSFDDKIRSIYLNSVKEKTDAKSINVWLDKSKQQQAKAPELPKLPIQRQ
jgi:hypothetical protein